MRAILAAILCTASLQAWAEPAPLDPPYRGLIHPRPQAEPFSRARPLPPARSDTPALIAKQSPVKDQWERGTCSIFSSIALLESLVFIQGKVHAPPDLSEEWLQYLSTQDRAEEGSEAPENFALLHRHGVPSEERLPYLGEMWTSKGRGQPAQRCGHLPRGERLKGCLISHRDPVLLTASEDDLRDPSSPLYDPEFADARDEAWQNKAKYFAHTPKFPEGRILDSVSEIQDLLLSGQPLILELDFYYGSWNHPAAEDLNIGLSPTLWQQGVVTYPEKGSADRVFSKKKKSGHSVVLVGFDNNREIEYTVRMSDGRRRTFKRRGVYYFKNSWGKDEFGRSFMLDGRKYPGYGLILQDHAHEFGQFFRLSL